MSQVQGFLAGARNDDVPIRTTGKRREIEGYRGRFIFSDQYRFHDTCLRIPMFYDEH